MRAQELKRMWFWEEKEKYVKQKALPVMGRVSAKFIFIF